MSAQTRLAEIDRRLATIEVEIDRIERAPLPTAEIEARIDTISQALAERAELHQLGSHLIRRDREGAAAAVPTVIKSLDPISAAALFPNQVAEILRSAAEAVAEGMPEALTDAEQARRFRPLAIEKAALEQEAAQLRRQIEFGARQESLRRRIGA